MIAEHTAIVALWLEPWGIDRPFITDPSSGRRLTFKQALSPTGYRKAESILCGLIRSKFYKTGSIIIRPCPKLEQVHISPAYFLSTGRVNRICVNWHIKLPNDEVFGSDFFDYKQIKELVKPRYLFAFTNDIEAVV